VITPQYCQLLARYGRWMNERMLAALAPLPDAERKRDRGAFFGSIHRTLNHLVWADSIWISRLAGGRFAVPAFGADMYEDFDALSRERDAVDTRILGWAGSVDEAALRSTLEYRAASDGRRRTLPTWVAAAHLFNHATHHRGQLTTLMKQAGVDPGVTDLPWLPGVTKILDD
jgi:uncharacterized damage-inducible protein DinB